MAGERRSVGRHLVWVEPPLFLVEHHGPLALEEFNEIYDCLQGSVDNGETQYFLIDISDTPPPSTEVRTRMRNSTELLPLRAMVAFGGSPLIVAMTRLIRRGMELIGRAQVRFLMFTTLAEAQAWIESDRQKADAGAQSNSNR